MARGSTVFVCSQCGHSSPKWHGQCPGCEEWNTLAEERAPAREKGKTGSRSAGAAGEPTRLRDVSADRTPRMPTGIAGLDRLLGGGVVPGSLVLVGGSPGIGKSTLTTMALGLAEAAGRRTLYVSGEESAAQIRLRAERLEAGSAPGSLSVPVIAETDLGAILATIEAERPELCVVDSVQTIGSGELTGAPGTVGQVREAASRLMELAKRTGTAIVLVGHVTKEGSLAGPRVLEHLVDCVLQFDGERERTYRTLRALKNRFGATSDVAVFEMDDQDPYLADRLPGRRRRAGGHRGGPSPRLGQGRRRRRGDRPRGRDDRRGAGRDRRLRAAPGEHGRGRRHARALVR